MTQVAELEERLKIARETITRLNRRAQAAERALPDYARIIALPPDGEGVRFVSGGLGRALLATIADRQQRRIVELKAALSAADRLAHQFSYFAASGAFDAYWKARGGREACTVCQADGHYTDSIDVPENPRE